MAYLWHGTLSQEHPFEFHSGLNPVYQIRLQGHLGPQRRDWFDGFRISNTGNGDTLLTGEIVDQAALYGVLKKVRDIGVPLLSVICLNEN